MAGAEQTALRVTLFLDAIDPPVGTLGCDYDAQRLAFAGWVSLIGALKTVTAGSLGRSVEETMTTPDALGGPE